MIRVVRQSSTKNFVSGGCCWGQSKGKIKHLGGLIEMKHPNSTDSAFVSRSSNHGVPLMEVKRRSKLLIWRRNRHFHLLNLFPRTIITLLVGENDSCQTICCRGSNQSHVLVNGHLYAHHGVCARASQMSRHRPFSVLRPGPNVGHSGILRCSIAGSSCDQLVTANSYR